jgi:hypothetical protein
VAVNYTPLRHYLETIESSEWKATFCDIEHVLCASLPSSARKHNAWWSNTTIGHTHARTWLNSGWKTANVNIEREMVTFLRNGHRVTNVAPLQNEVPSRKPELPRATHTWDLTAQSECVLHLDWTHLGAILADKNNRIEFPQKAPALPGLYRIRIRRRDDTESRYIGETDNLKRRFQNYRNPGNTQQTNLRINDIFLAAIADGAEVAVSIVTSDARISRNSQIETADFSSKAIRRLFENFAQVIEGDTEIESLNR